MIVCICHKVSESEIKKAVQQGVCGMAELRKQYHVGTQCGQCCQHAKNMLKEFQLERDKPSCQAA